MVSREVVEGVQAQGVDESIIYSITTTPWCTNPTLVSVVVKDAGVDVTATVAPGVGGVSGDVITLPAIGSLTKGHTYRVEVKFTGQSNTFEAYFLVRAQV